MREAVGHLALFQGTHVSDAWGQAGRDCAGLVRFVYKESLSPRSYQQRQKLRLPPALSFPQVSLKARLAINGWPAMWLGQDETPQYYVDSQGLVDHNFWLRSWKIEDARPGDLLVYHLEDEWGIGGRHVMVFAGGAGSGLVVYHNGSQGAEAAVRVTSVEQLLKSSDPLWVPLRHNAHFRGIYSWNKFKNAQGACGSHAL